MKRRGVLTIVCVVLMVVCLAISSLAVLARYEGVTFAQSSGRAASAEVRSILDGFLTDYLAKDTALRQWRLLSQEIVCTASETTDVLCSATYVVHRLHTLNCSTAGDWPAVKGRLNYVRDHDSGLTEAHRTRLQRELDMWTTDVSAYIRDPQDCYDYLKVCWPQGTWVYT